MTFTNQDFTDIFKAPLRDKQWFSKLCLQGGLLLFLSFFLVGIPFLNGFLIRLLEQSIKDDPSLPDWSEWGTYWKVGWKSLLVNFVYSLPIFIIWPFMFASAIGLQFIDDNSPFMLLGVIFFFIIIACYICIFAYGVILNFIQNATAPLIAVGAPISQAFNIKGYIWPYIKHNALNIFIGFFIGYLASFIAMVGFLGFFVGYFFTMPYAIAIISHVHGLIYRRSAIQYKP